MRISRLYLDLPLAPDTRVQLNPESGHYLKTVLRLKKGFELTVFNGQGGEYTARVAELHREAVSLDLETFNPREAESPLQVSLGLGISRGERMDLAVQKAVELGVSRITPLFTEHCVVRLDETKRGNRRQHWQKVAISACEQCGRNRVPEVEEPVALDHWIGEQTGLKLFFDPLASASLKSLPPPEGMITILSGPEGGFADRERRAAVIEGFLPVRLGPRILRTETAVLATLAAVQALWGDWT